MIQVSMCMNTSIMCTVDLFGRKLYAKPLSSPCGILIHCVLGNSFIAAQWPHKFSQVL